MPPAIARYPGQAPIEAYGNGGFRFAGMSHRGSIICLPDQIVAWPVASLAALGARHVEPLVEARASISILLMGTGREIGALPADVAATLRAAGLAFDVMDSGAAARTYNVLLAERRAVAAALIAID